jgi:prepilin signal peptidase PulO-like enzyme (type II secretory pathway)
VNAQIDALGTTWCLLWPAFLAAAAAGEARTLAPRLAGAWPVLFFVAAAAGLAALEFDASNERFTRATAAGALAAAAVIDAETGLLIDRITLPACLTSAVWAAASGCCLDAVLGLFALAGPATALLLVGRGRWLGWGDVKALAFLGIAFGPLRGAIALSAACLCGLLSTLVRRRRLTGGSVPFGPYLATGSLLGLVPSDAALRYAGLAV